MGAQSNIDRSIITCAPISMIHNEPRCPTQAYHVHIGVQRSDRSCHFTPPKYHKLPAFLKFRHLWLDNLQDPHSYANCIPILLKPQQGNWWNPGSAADILTRCMLPSRSLVATNAARTLSFSDGLFDSATHQNSPKNLDLAGLLDCPGDASRDRAAAC